MNASASNNNGIQATKMRYEKPIAGQENANKIPENSERPKRRIGFIGLKVKTQLQSAVIIKNPGSEFLPIRDKQYKLDLISNVQKFGRNTFSLKIFYYQKVSSCRKR